jgi:DNA-binding Lrp family transcriptional regulator
MKLTEREKAIIAAMHLEADTPAVEIQRILGFREATVRHCIKRLIDKGLLRFYPFINVYPLGFNAYSLYFSLSDKGKQVRSDLMQHFKASPQVSWIAEIGGRYQLCITFLAKDLIQVQHFLEKVSAVFPDVFAEKVISPQLELTLFGPKYLGYPQLGRSWIKWGVTDSQVVLDDLDHKILSNLEQSHYSSLSMFARQLSLPVSTVNWRVKQLEKRGVIVGFVHLINTSMLGMHTYKLLVSARSAQDDFRKALFGFAAEHPNITTFIQCIGGWDFELGVEIEDAAGVSRITQSMQKLLSNNIHSVEVIPQFKELKIACYPFKPAMPAEDAAGIAANS